MLQFFLLSFFISLPSLHHLGTYSHGGFLFLVFLFAIYLWLIKRKNSSEIPFNKPQHLLPAILVVLIAQALSFILNDSDMNGTRTLGQLFFRIFFFAAIGITIHSLFENMIRPKTISGKKMFLLLALAFLLRVSLTRIVVQPNVDIYDTLRLGPSALIHGFNPYQQNYGGFISSPPPSGITSFAYWPTAFISAPILLIVKDPRLVLSGIELALIIILYFDLKKLNNRGWVHIGIPLLLAYHPLFILSTTRSFLDPLILILFYLGFKAMNKRQLTKAGIYWGLSIGAKYLYFPPFIFLLTNFRKIRSNWKILMSFGLTILIILIPFLWWDSASFLESTIFQQLRHQSSGLSQLGLNITGFLFTQFQIYSIGGIWIILGVFGYFLLLWNRHFPNEITEYVAVLYLLLLVFPQSFGEQYYFLTNAMLIASAFTWEKNTQIAAKIVESNNEPNKATATPVPPKLTMENGTATARTIN